MPNAPRTKQIIDDLVKRRGVYESLSNILSAAQYNPMTGLFQLEEFILTNYTMEVVDSGGATGGWASVKLADFPADNSLACLAGFISVEVLSVGAGISATGPVLFGVGTSAAITGSLSGNAVNLSASCGVTLVAGAGSNRATGPAIPTYLDTWSATYDNFYFNVAVADANISATANVTFNATARFAWLDIGRGV